MHRGSVYSAMPSAAKELPLILTSPSRSKYLRMTATSKDDITEDDKKNNDGFSVSLKRWPVLSKHTFFWFSNSKALFSISPVEFHLNPFDLL